jgi:hypothetical protein
MQCAEVAAADSSDFVAAHPEAIQALGAAARNEQQGAAAVPEFNQSICLSVDACEAAEEPPVIQ